MMTREVQKSKLVVTENTKVAVRRTLRDAHDKLELIAGMLESLRCPENLIVEYRLRPISVELGHDLSHRFKVPDLDIPSFLLQLVVRTPVTSMFGSRLTINVMPNVLSGVVIVIVQEENLAAGVSSIVKTGTRLFQVGDVFSATLDLGQVQKHVESLLSETYMW